MKKLPQIIKAQGHEFREVRRESQFAIYAQYDPKYPETQIATVVIKIGFQKDGTIMGKQYPDRETFPSKGQWGSRAWTFSFGSNKGLTSAIAKFNELNAR